MPAGSGIDITSLISVLFSKRESTRLGKAWIHPPCFLISYRLINMVGWDFSDWMDPSLWVGVLWFQNRGDSNRKTPLSQLKKRILWRVLTPSFLERYLIFVKVCQISLQFRVLTENRTHYPMTCETRLQTHTQRRDDLAFTSYCINVDLQLCEESHTLLGCKPRRLM